MDTPGFEKENWTKPEITKEIEGQSKIVSPDSCAKHMLNSIQSNRYYISNDMLIILIRLGELARVCVNGGVPRGNFVGEVLCSPLLAIVFSCWAFVTDMDIKNWFKKQNKA